MGYHPRIESPDLVSLATIRSRNSELWLINNPELEENILAYAAKFATRYQVRLYALAIEGNHIHTLAKHPECNRAAFQRDFNSCVARAVPRHAPGYPGGRFWARRYSSELIPENEDIENYFFYTVLQPIQDGLVDKLSEYPGYNCFNDAIKGIVRKYSVVNWATYNDAKRWNPQEKIGDHIQIVELQYARLPGYESLAQSEYKKLMLEKLEQRRLQIIAARGDRAAVGPAALKRKKPGSRPYRTKKSNINTHRPRILCSCPYRRAEHYGWYFSIYFEFKNASQAFRNGKLSTAFPPGTYRPPYLRPQPRPPNPFMNLQ